MALQNASVARGCLANARLVPEDRAEDLLREGGAIVGLRAARGVELQWARFGQS